MSTIKRAPQVIEIASLDVPVTSNRSHQQRKARCVYLYRTHPRVGPEVTEDRRTGGQACRHPSQGRAAASELADPGR